MLDVDRSVFTENWQEMAAREINDRQSERVGGGKSVCGREISAIQLVVFEGAGSPTKGGKITDSTR